MSCTTCMGPNPLDLAGQFEKDMLAATFASQTLWSAGLGALLGFMRVGPAGAGVIVGGGAMLLAHLNEPELAKKAPPLQFVWMGVVSAGAVLLERAIIGDKEPK